jgi:spastic paraplegia protein 7
MIDLPTLLERTELFELYLNKLKLKSPVSTYANKLAKLTPGMSGKYTLLDSRAMTKPT